MKQSTASHTYPVPDPAPKMRIDQWLQRMLDGPSRTEIQKWIRSGIVTADGNRVTPGVRITPGMTISIAADRPEKPCGLQPADLPLDILLEDEACVVVNKPTGQVVHPAPGHPDNTVLNAMLHHFPDMIAAGPSDRPGVVHRLDAGTSGVLLFARTTQDLENLQQQFRERTTGKRYLTVCRGIPNPVRGEVHTPIGRHPVHRQKRAVNGTGAREARSLYRMIRGLAHGQAAELEVDIKTGRTHQIRVHLDSIQHPVLGDPIYGGRRTTLPPPCPAPPRLMLHAAQLTFMHPRTGRSISLEAPPPFDYLAYCEQLSNS
jgi:23S rRNA pseudouridine1911/1915/1917 synthase